VFEGQRVKKGWKKKKGKKKQKTGNGGDGLKREPFPCVEKMRKPKPEKQEKGKNKSKRNDSKGCGSMKHKKQKSGAPAKRDCGQQTKTGGAEEGQRDRIRA